MAKKESGFIHWYESYKGKKVTGVIYSAGASVVIIGALFKIMHFPGAGPVLMTGMITEAILFMIGVLDKPHVDFHWENVFPQLLGYGAEPEYLAEVQSRPRPTLLGAGVESGVAPTQEQGKKSVNAPALTEADMDSLKQGIEGLAKTAVQLQELGKVATSTTKLGEKMEAAGAQMEAAGAAAGKFAASSDAVSKKNDELANAYTTIVADMQGVVEGTKAYQKSVDGLGAKLGSINSVYELQLNALQAQVEAYKAQAAQVNVATEQVKLVTADVQKIQAAAAEAVKSHADYEAASKKLAQQVADLNKVYGNMLNALA
ncbi:MAG: gliding motility protein GldL [Paludibacteraceae bacterium]|nr:gliding motility protein GldL [Paludibacteraceae bacterium]